MTTRRRHAAAVYTRNREIQSAAAKHCGMARSIATTDLLVSQLGFDSSFSLI